MDNYRFVTSLAEVWIETTGNEIVTLVNGVTSLAEVWIETEYPYNVAVEYLSLPLRKCGLKPRLEDTTATDYPVTSLAEVWIETDNLVQYLSLIHI